jgi:16S rRNA processing protein RimM
MSPYGLKGLIKIKTHSGETEHVLALVGSAVTLRKANAERVLQVIAAKEYGPFVLFEFGGITSPEQVHQLSGYELWVPRDRAAPLTTDEYYVADLVGCRLVYQGTAVAEVRAVWSNGPGDMLEVQTLDDRVAHVPFSPQFIGQVDHHAKTMELLHDWILE